MPFSDGPPSTPRASLSTAIVQIQVIPSQSQGFPQAIAGPGQSQPETQSFRPCPVPPSALLPVPSTAGPSYPVFCTVLPRASGLGKSSFPSLKKSLMKQLKKEQERLTSPSSAELIARVELVIPGVTGLCPEQHRLDIPKAEKWKTPPERSPTACQASPLHYLSWVR